MRLNISKKGKRWKNKLARTYCMNETQNMLFLLSLKVKKIITTQFPRLL